MQGREVGVLRTMVPGVFNSGESIADANGWHNSGLRAWLEPLYRFCSGVVWGVPVLIPELWRMLWLTLCSHVHTQKISSTYPEHCCNSYTYQLYTQKFCGGWSYSCISSRSSFQRIPSFHLWCHGLGLPCTHFPPSQISTLPNILWGEKRGLMH